MAPGEVASAPAAALEARRAEAARCTACSLHQHATRTVFGEGPVPARLMLVGEQPGDREDREGRPFVGPAGQILDRALAEAGIDRGTAYVTNAVKHFRWVRRGSRRIHQTPLVSEINPCHPWLDAELEGGREAYVTVHPSSILRVDGPAQRHLEMARLVDDFSLVARRLRTG